MSQLESSFTSEHADLLNRWALEVQEKISWKVCSPCWHKALQMNWLDFKDERFCGIRLSKLENFIKAASFLASSVEETFHNENLMGNKIDLVLVDGSLKYRDPKLNFLTLKQAMQLGPLVSNRYTQLNTFENDPWALANAGLSHEAIFCRLPDRFEGQIHINFERITSQAISFPRLTLWVPKHSKVNVTVSSIGIEDHLAIECIDVIQEANSQFEMVWARHSGSKSLSMSYVRAHLNRDATFKLCDLSEGGQVSRLDAHVQLLEENASCDLIGLNMLAQKSQSQVNILVEHKAENCHSSQLFKAVVKDLAKNIFQGKIYVHPQAQQTRAYQISRNLVLNEGAVAQSRPNLEILADDVKASHGSTTGQVDEEALFYMLSRGIGLQKATSLLVHGFLVDIIERITDLNLKLLWKKKLQRYH
jgi:Fe-S cluster assembly protein SufD